MKMHKNPIWITFLTIVLLITGIFTVKAFAAVYEYMSLSLETEAAGTAWTTIKEEDDRYVPHVKYTYQVRDAFYQGESSFQKDTTANPWAAENALKELAAKKYKVWYSNSTPSYSSLHKNFPFKPILYAGVLWALSIYFFWLGAYVAKLQK